MDLFTNEPKRVTLRDIAERMGISKASVSRALNGRKGVSEAFRAKIQSEANAMGYRPDLALSALSRHRWSDTHRNMKQFAIAVVQIRETDHTGTTNKASLENSIEGAREESANRGIQFDTVTIRPTANNRPIARQLFYRGFDGLIFLVDGIVDEWLFPTENFSCVSVGMGRPFKEMHSVVPDWFNSVRIAVKQALSLGYRRIGFCLFNRFNPEIDELVLAAILMTKYQLAQKFGPQPEILFYHKHPEVEYDHFIEEQPDFKNWFKNQRPDVIIDTNQLVYWQCHELGIAIPEEVGYISLLGNLHSECPSRIAAVSLHRRMAGRVAVDLLTGLIQLNLKGIPENPYRLTIPAFWQDGASVRKA